MAVLEINDLVIDFETDQGVVEAIDHLSLSVREGESGCGKTTVARSILGIIPQPPARLRSGEIRFQGEDLLLLLLKSLVKERGTSVVLITHDLGVVAKVCDRVIVMYAGQEAEVAPTPSLFNHPSHPYTQKLLDSLPDRQQGEIQGIPGVVPSLIDPPRGCRFNTRCDAVMPICRQECPPAVELFPDHLVRCHLYPTDHGTYDA
jgi:oligopeptide/dipeptide ABC transporter ATP-binding protein